jgi:ssDNA-binding Zn-finger/Zn-ribbon topoisomerase 1
MNVNFDCPHCNKTMSIEAGADGKQVQCPTCSNVVTVPESQAPDTKNVPNDEVLFCAQCGQKNLENNFKCTRCGFPLHAAPQPQHVAGSDGTLGGLIPYKNAAALWAYYLAVFSLIPFFGIPIGVAAVIVGFRGLKNATTHPETKGKVHAWIGIILGGVCAVGYALLIVILMGV